MKIILLILTMLLTPIAGWAATYEITTAGNNWGIGSAAPGAQLDVQGTARIFGNLSVAGTVSSTGTGPMNISGTNVGINSANAGQLLDVNGTLRTTNFQLTGNGAAAGFILQSNGSTGIGTWVAASSSSTPGGGLNAVQYNNPLGTLSGKEQTFSFNGTNVGIGTTNGTQLMDVRGTINAVSFVASGTAASYFTTNVGINSTVPGTWLDIQGTTRITGLSATSTTFIVPSGYVGLGNSSPGMALDVTGTIRVIGSNQAISIGSANPGSQLEVQGTARVFGWLVTKAGSNVGIGSLAPGAQLDIQGTIRENGSVGATCPAGSPTASFQTVNGIVVHC